VYPELDAIFRKYLSGERAQRDTEYITQFYRSPGASGYHAATQYVADRLRDAGADEVVEERYPLDGETSFMGRTMPPAWEPISADLEVIMPVQAPIVSYDRVPSTLPWWCGPTPPEGVIVQLVDVGKGLAPSDYEGKPVKGNAVLIRDHESRPAWHHAAELARKMGAAGIVTDYLHSQNTFRTRQSVPDAVQLLRMTARFENPWAFCIGFRAAEQLADLVRRGPVRVRARVDVKSFKGEGVNLFGVIRGTDRAHESVFFISHTSAGTKPCANCAAGPSLMVEMLRAIQSAIRAGDIPRPRRTIRFLFVAEGLGSSYYLDKNLARLSDIKAAICLDSVGHSQSRLKSSLVFYRSPDSIPSYVNEVGGSLIEELPKEGEWPFRNGKPIPLVNFQELPYTPWSDNHYWVTFGVPAPLIMSWPDLYFHTQLLTAENTDPMVFERAGRVLGSLALGIARAGARDVPGILQEVAAKGALRIGRAARDAMISASSAPGAAQAIAHVADRESAALRSALDLAKGDPGEDRVRGLADALENELRSKAAAEIAKLEAFGVDLSRPETGGPDANRVPRRTMEVLAPGVAGLTYDEMGALVERMVTDDPQANWESLRIVGDEFWNLTDGKRTIADIARTLSAQFAMNITSAAVAVIARGLVKTGKLALS
jgi:hypothetical protein